MVIAFAVLLAAGRAAELPPLTATGTLAIEAVTPSAKQLGCYEKFELTVRLSASYQNPFDPAQIEVTGQFTTPGGARVEVPGFFYQPYRVMNAEQEAAAPLLQADGAPCWIMLFTPGAAGAYRGRVVARDRAGRVEAALL